MLTSCTKLHPELESVFGSEKTPSIFFPTSVVYIYTCVFVLSNSVCFPFCYPGAAGKLQPGVLGYLFVVICECICLLCGLICVCIRVEMA